MYCRVQIIQNIFWVKLGHIYHIWCIKGIITNSKFKTKNTMNINSMAKYFKILQQAGQFLKNVSSRITQTHTQQSTYYTIPCHTVSLVKHNTLVKSLQKLSRSQRNRFEWMNALTLQTLAFPQRHKHGTVLPNLTISYFH